MTQQDHIRCTALCVAIIDSRSPSEAKATAERFFREVRESAIEECAELADTSIRVTGTALRKLK